MSISNYQISIIFVLRGGGGGGGFRPIILENSILRYGLKRKDMSDFLLGLFWVCVHNFVHVRPRSKLMGPKTKIYTSGDRAFKVSSFDLPQKNKTLKKIMSQSDEKLPSYANYKVAR